MDRGILQATNNRRFLHPPYRRIEGRPNLSFYDLTRRRDHLGSEAAPGEFRLLGC